MQEILKKYLMPLTELEKLQKKTGSFVVEFEEEEVGFAQGNLKIQDRLFGADTSIVIRKHRRFASYPPHTHEFLEFNYMLSGSSRQMVNGEEVVLKEQQILLLDSNSKHGLEPLGEKDILVNFLFKAEGLDIDILKRIDTRSEGLTYRFLLNALLGMNYHEKYLILDIKENPEIQASFEQMMLEYILKKHLCNEIMNVYSQVLFLQLSRVFHSQLSEIYGNVPRARNMIRILQKIEADYSSITLEGLAAELGYNKNYLSNYIKKETGRTFKDLLTQTRLQEARGLILSTKMPVEAISEYVGFSNKTQFYKKFTDFYQKTPKQIRRENDS